MQESVHCTPPFPIPRGRRKNYVPHWGKECETLCRPFTRAPLETDSDRAASSLLSRLEQKKQEWWEEAVNSIDFSDSIRKAWRTINKLTGMSGRSFCRCPVSANSIASQLVKNRAHKTGNRESTRLVNKELSDLSKIPTSEGHSISEPFRPESLLLPSDARSQESLRDWTPFSRSSYFTPGRLSSLGLATSSLLACTNSKFQRSGEEH